MEMHYSENKFNDDIENHLRLENEILKIKMQAEHGAVFGAGTELDPRIEHTFLKQIQDFEEAWKNVKTITVYELLGSPAFKKECVLSNKNLQVELDKISQIMESKQLFLSTNDSYEPRLIYRFITEELFLHETDDLQLPGLTKNFIYEEFHPNHKQEIGSRTEEFFEAWATQNFENFPWIFSKCFVLESGITLPGKSVLKKLEQVFDSYVSFSDIQTVVENISFQCNEDEDYGLGHAEGFVKYKGAFESGEETIIQGPFKIYMNIENGMWKIFYFVWPGFNW